MPNPLQMLEALGKASQAAAIYGKIKKLDRLDPDGKPIPNGKPDLDEMLDEGRHFISLVDQLNKSAHKLIEMETNLVDQINVELAKVK